jgi:hypothetical protein
MNITETLIRAGLTTPKNIKEYVTADLLPAEYHYDAAHGQDCVDSYTHDIGAPEHLGDFMVVRETEHWCQGSTKRTFHIAPAATHRPNGGEIPLVLCKILREAFCSHTPEQVWAMTPGQAKTAVRGSWTAANTVAQAVMNGEIGEEWVPEGSTGGAGGMWLYEALRASYKRNVNPLPLVRRMFPGCSWEFTREACERAARGMYPIYETGDIVFSCEVQGGYVKATLTGERTNSPL